MSARRSNSAIPRGQRLPCQGRHVGLPLPFGVTQNSMSLATLQAALAERFPSALAQPSYAAPEMVSSGVEAVDALTGGLPRGSLVEICGARCSGRTSLLLAMLAAGTARGEACALVDTRDSFDPASGAAAGIALERLLWVRCVNIEQAFRSAEWILTGGGLGVVALDLGEIPPQTVRRVPLNVWFRFRRAVENTPTVLAILEQQPHAGSCAALALELSAEESRWQSAVEYGGLPPFFEAKHAHARLLEQRAIRADIVRARYGNVVKRPIQIDQPERDAGRTCRFAAEVSCSEP